MSELILPVASWFSGFKASGWLPRFGRSESAASETLSERCGLYLEWCYEKNAGFTHVNYEKHGFAQQRSFS